MLERDKENFNANKYVPRKSQHTAPAPSRSQTSTTEKVTPTYASASTSVDDLIRKIDADLGLSPDKKLPHPSKQTDLNQILSVSADSDTSTRIMSPESLNFYINRFRNTRPSQPSHRSGTVSEKIDSVELPSMDELTLDSINTSSLWSDFLSTDITSSTDSTPQPPEPKNETTERTSADRPKSYLEALTGKCHSELAELVPKDVTNPTNESDDILFQWRLKRRIIDAQATGLQEMQNSRFGRGLNSGLMKLQCSPQATDVFSHRDIRAASNIEGLTSDFSAPRPPNCDRIHPDLPKPDLSKPNLPKPELTRCQEIQTDAEKREISCQTVEGGGTPSKRKLYLSPSHARLLREAADYADSLSDISVSSFSTDDLTAVSDMELSESEEEKEAEVRASLNGTLVSEGERETPQPQSGESAVIATGTEKPVDQGEALTEQRVPPVTDTTSPDQSSLQQRFALDEKSARELKYHLSNIKESLCDELVGVFIDRYFTVLDQIEHVEKEIERRESEE